MGFFGDAWGTTKGVAGDLGDKIFGKSNFSAKSGAEAADWTQADEDRRLALEARGQQQGFNAYLQNVMAGNGPTVAQTQFDKNRQQVQNQIASQAASARGGNVALAARSAANAGANASQTAAMDASMLRAKEQQEAAGMYGSNLSNMRSQDANMQQLSQDRQKALIDAKTRQEGMNADIQSKNAENASKGIGGLASMAAGVLAMSDIRAKEDIEPLSYEEEEAKRKKDERFKAGLSMFQSGAGMLSDERQKERRFNLDDELRAAEEAMRKTEPYQYRYKPDAAARMHTDTDPRLGIMAQDLEKSEAGRSVVVDTPAGKALDKDRVLGLLLAASSAQQDEIDSLKRKKGAK